MKKKKIAVLAVVIVLAAGIIATIFWAARYFFRPDKKDIVINPEQQTTASVAEKYSTNDSIVTASKSSENNQNEKTQTVPSVQPTKQVTQTSSQKEKTPLNIINKLVSWGFQTASGRKIDTIIIHSSYDALDKNPYSVSGLINEYKVSGVSPHYLIDRSGDIYRLVPDNDIAYQAGASRTPDGRTDVNNFSIGIELMNTMTGKYTDAQYASLRNLLFYLEQKYKIKYVLGHDQIAPGRKTDPWNFDWSKIKSLVPAY